MFLLDIRYDPKTKKILKWIKDQDGCKLVKETYFPKIYISGNMNLRFFDKVPGIRDIYFEEKSTSLGKKPEKVMCVIIDPIFMYDITTILESNGYDIYNIDISTVRKYLLEKNLFPLAKLEGDLRDNIINDDQYTLDYDINLLSKELTVIPNTKGIFTINDPIDKIFFGDSIIEGSEQYILETLNSEIIKQDPDLILTNSGDSFELPYLYHRASLYNIKLQLGREENNIDNEKRNGISYFSYGKIYYKPRGRYLSGRLHIDKSSFLFREGGLLGLIDISRIARIPLQELSRLSPGSVVNALQADQALRDNILIQWKKDKTIYIENWKTVQQLEESNRGGIILEPKVGIHENVYELDYVSLFPNIMVNHNISPETVLCDCCPDGPKVPFINHNTCSKIIGLIPRVLKPLINRRLIYKKRAKDAKNDNNILKSEEYDKKQKVIKWLLVTSFGYIGFNKAHFGNIYCYESIVSYAKNILLRTIKISSDMGYDILHGLVDCVWIKGPDPKELRETIIKEIGMDIELKGFYNWIVFLPNKTDDNGSPFRYYGLMNNGKLKIRGIEMRQGSTPIFIKNFQIDMINKLAEAKTAYQFYSKIPEAISILKRYARNIYNNDCRLTELIFEIRVSRNLNEYKVCNNQVAALRQLEDLGVIILPGQSVQFIIADHKSKNHHKRVIIPELFNNNTKYDKEKYYQYLLSAAESILLPFGYNVKYLDEIVNNRIQTKLYQYV